MRNLKRALSLALASVMLLGMMVVGASAASYPDVDDNDNVEAIEVLNAVNVMIGDRGNFRPDAAVNRHEMAVIMAKLVLGNEVADNYVGSHPFTDTFPWADKYVAACYENDLISGRGGNLFAGNQPLTAVEAASMMLRALGYKDLNKGADDWRAPLVSMANQLRLFSGVTADPKAQLNRNQVAQLVLNTLKSSVVDLKDNTFTATDGDGKLVISGGNREYIVRSSRESYAYAINSTESTGNSASGVQGATVELGEHLYNGKLRLNSTTDVFERPARQWEYDGKEIGTYMKEELLRQEWTGEVTGKMLYDLLTKSIIEGNGRYDFTISVDGEVKEENLKLAAASGASAVNYFFDQGYMHSNYKAGVGGTGNGVLTQVFVDTAERHVYISIINTYLAKAAGDYSSVRETVTYNVYGVDNNVAAGGTSVNPILVKRTAAKSDGSAWVQTLTVSGDDFDIKDVKKDDIILVNVAKGTIQNMVEPEVMASATLTAFAKNDYVVSEGSTIKYNSAAEYDVDVLDRFTSSSGTTNLRDKHYNLYLDANGYLAGIELVEEDTNYIFLTGIDSGLSDLRNKTAEAAGILTDGTFVNFQMNMDKSRRADGTTVFKGGSMWNTWCTYSVDSNKVYTLREVGNDPTAAGSAKVAQFHDADYVASAAAGKDINIKNYSLAGAGSGYNYVYGNEKSVYMTVKLANITAREDLDNTPGNGGKVINGLAKADGTTLVTNLDIDKNDRVAIISDVDVRTEGIANTDMTTWTYSETLAKATTGNGTIPPDENTAGTAKLMPTGVYTLYNKDGYVVAAIVIGEDNGLSKSIYWISSAGVKEERFDASSARATDGEWVWSREVVDLTDPELNVTKIYERGSALEVIGNGTTDGGSSGNMKQYGVYQIKFNGSNEVTGATLASSVTGISFTSNPAAIEGLIGGSKEIVVYSNRNANGTSAAPGTNLTADGESIFPITFSNGTLHVGTGASEGFPVSTDVLTLLIQTNGGKKTTTPYNGTAGLTSALNLMHVENNGAGGTQKRYDITALIRGGRAITIVINDAIIDGAVNNPVTPVTPGNHPTDHFVDMVTHGNALDYYDHANPTSDVAAGNITRWLAAEGYTVKGNPTFNGTSFTWIATKNGIDNTFTWTPGAGAVNAPTVTLDGKKVTFSGTYNTLLAALQKTGTAASSAAYYLRRENGGTLTGYALQNASTTIVDNDVVKTGYKKVTIDGSAAAAATLNLTGFELGTGGDSTHYFAPANTPVQKGSTDAATAAISGFEVGSNNEFLPYGTTLDAIDGKDAGVNDGTAAIAAISKVRITVYNDSVGAATPVCYRAIAYNASTPAGINSLNGINGTGTKMYVGSVIPANLKALSDTVAVSADFTVHVGYVDIGTLSGTSNANLAYQWTVRGSSTALSAGNIVKVGDTIVATVTISGTYIDASDTIAFGAGATNIQWNLASTVSTENAGLAATSNLSGVTITIPSTATGTITGTASGEYTVGTSQFTNTFTVGHA